MAKGNKGGGPPDNTYATKFDTKPKRKALLNAYIKHCEAGYPDSMLEECNIKTFREYCKNFPVEFPTDLIEAAQAKRAKLIYDVGWRGTMGIPISYKNSKGQTVAAPRPFNPKSWQFIAMNMLGFRNRDDHTTKGKEIKSGGHVIYLPKELPDNYDEKMKPPEVKNATTGPAK